MNCWEFKKCGREADGPNSRDLGVCPAYPDHGRDCASVAGTLCGGEVQGTFAVSLPDCMLCDFYWSESYDRSPQVLKTEGRSAPVMVSDGAVDALRESEARYRLLFHYMINGFAYCRIVCDGRGNPVDALFVEVNRAFERLTGLRKADVIGRRATDVMPGIERDSFDWIGILGRVAMTGEPVRFERYALPLDRWYSVSAYSPVKGDVVAVFEDVSERRRAEEKLRESQALLSELHHRTKNNMNVISSLISLQAVSLPGGEVLQMFRDLQHRISSMALVHQKLYQSRDLSNASFRDYVEDLAGSLLDSFWPGKGRVSLRLDIRSFALSF